MRSCNKHVLKIIKMSTNFYLKRIPTEEETKRIVDKIKSEATTENLKNILDEALYEATEAAKSIHLGKRSGGWRFNWELWGNKYYQCSLDSIREFVESRMRDGWFIVDEYRNKYDWDGFIKEIEYNLKNGMFSDDPKNRDTYGYTWGVMNEVKVVDKNAGITLRFSRSEDFR